MLFRIMKLGEQHIFQDQTLVLLADRWRVIYINLLFWASWPHETETIYYVLNIWVDNKYMAKSIYSHNFTTSVAQEPGFFESSGK